MPPRASQFATRISHFTLPLLLALLLYFPTLTLPFYWDDVANFLWADLRPLASIWIDSTGFPFYRPLGFTLWRGIQLLFGPTRPLPFHALNLITHLVNGWLAGALAWRVASGERRDDRHPSSVTRHLSALAACLMIAFPFAAPVVPLVASEFHLLVTTLTLGAVLCALEFRETRQWRWAALGFALAALAPFEHESGVVTGALMGWAILVIPDSKLQAPNSQHAASTRRFAIRNSQFAIPNYLSPLTNYLLPLLALLANLLYLPWWAHIPKTRSENFAWVGWESLGQSAVFFLQGLTFPFQFAARWLMETWGWSDIVAASILCVVALVLAVVMLRTSRSPLPPPASPFHPLLFALGYWLIASSPSLFGLPFSYNIVSPRLQVFPSPAAVVLWSVVFVAIAGRLSQFAILQSSLTPCHLPIVTLLALLYPVFHIVKSVALHDYALSPLWTLADAVRAHPHEKQLFLNPPNWVAPVKADYALGHEGVEIMPAYLTPQMIAWAHTGVTAPIEGLAFPNVFPGLKEHYFEAWGKIQQWEDLAAVIADYDRVWLWKYADEEAVLLEVGAVSLETPDKPPTFVAGFDGRAYLTEARVEIGHDEARVELMWHSTGQTKEDVFTHVFDCDGNLLGQTDGAALGGTYPLWLWPAGVTVRDVRHVPLFLSAESDKSADSSVDCFVVELGLFNPLDGTRPPAYAQNGERFPNDSMVIRP